MKAGGVQGPNFAEASRKELREFNRKMAQLREARERELQGVKAQYDDRVKDTERDGEERLYRSKLSGGELLQDEMARQEKRLSEYSQGVQSQQRIMQAQRDQLAGHHETLLADMEINHRDKMQERGASLQEFAQDTDAKADQSMEEIRSEADRVVKNSHYLTARTLNEKYRHNDKKLREEDRRFSMERGKLARDQSEAMFKEKLEGDKNLQHTKTQNMVHLAQEKQTFQEKLESQRKHFEEIMKAHQLAYQQKMDAMIKGHNQSLEHVKSRHAGEMQSLTASQASYKAAMSSRSEDPFYNISALDPRVEDKLDHYEVTVAVPDYEQQNVILSGNKRSLKLTHSRRASNDVEFPDGSVNKTKRSESFTKEFPVADIVDPDKITRRYAEGLLTFRIFKA